MLFVSRFISAGAIIFNFFRFLNIMFHFMIRHRDYSSRALCFESKKSILSVFKIIQSIFYSFKFIIYICFREKYSVWKLGLHFHQTTSKTVMRNGSEYESGEMNLGQADVWAQLYIRAFELKFVIFIFLVEPNWNSKWFFFQKKNNEIRREVFHLFFSRSLLSISICWK